MKIYLILLGCTLLLFHCSNPRIKSIIQKEPITVDGLAYDWEKYPVEYNEEWHLVYGAVHSDSQLFLQFSFIDPQLARMMAHRGVTLWFGEDKNFGLKYTEQLSKDDFKRFSRDEMYIPNGVFTVVAGDTILASNILNYPSIAANLKLDNGLYCFEFSIPLYPANDLGFVKNIFSDRYYFGFEIAEINKEQRKKMKEAMSGRKPGKGRNPVGISGDRSGGRGNKMGGREGGRMANRFMDFEGKEICFEVFLDK